jgi:2-dehydropantoate 2-reductase
MTEIGVAGARDVNGSTRVAVVGGGAIGGTLAFHLIRRGVDVTVVETDPAQRDAIASTGIVLVGTDGERALARPRAVLDPAATQPAAPRFPIVLLAVKSQDTADAACWIEPRLAADGYVVSCQNGGNVPVIADHVGPARVVGAFVDIAADVVAPGVVRSGGVTRLVVGEPDGGESARTAELAALLPNVVEPSSDIRGLIWSKRVLATMYTMTALVDQDTADVIDRHRGLMTRAAREVVDIAAAERVPLRDLGYFDPTLLTANRDTAEINRCFDRLVAWQRGQAKTRVGPFRDIAIRGRRTEAHTELADLSRLAALHNLPSHHLKRLDEQLTELENKTRTFTERNLAASEWPAEEQGEK